MQVYTPTAGSFGNGSHPPAEGIARDRPATIGLLWNGKPNGDVALEAIRRRIPPDRPQWQAQAIVSGGMPTPMEMLEELAATVDAVIGAPAD